MSLSHEWLYGQWCTLCHDVYIGDDCLFRGCYYYPENLLMPQISPNVSCMAKATLDKTQLAGAKLRLFQTLTSIDNQTTLADLVAEECDYTGYPAGGETVAAWLGPILVAGGGASIFSGSVLFDWSGALPGVANTVTGWFIVLADGVTLWECGTFDNPIPMTAPGDGFLLDVEQNQPN